jgi:integrase
VREYFKEVCKRVGLPLLSPHALRHTHAVHLLEAGVNIKYVSERLGHASILITGTPISILPRRSRMMLYGFMSST